MSGRPTICLAANTTWYVHNFRQRLVTHLIEEGYGVTVWAPRDDYVARVEALGARHVHLDLHATSINPARELGAAIGMLGTLRRERPAALLTYTPKVNIYGCWAAARLGIPVIANVSGLGRAYVRGGWLRFVVRELYRVALRRAELVYFQNDEDRDEFLRLRIVAASRAARLPGSGVDLERFQPQAAADASKPFVFLLAARLLWDKGIGDFVDAARRVKERHPATEFWLAGFLDEASRLAVPAASIRQWEDEGVIRYIGASDDIAPLLARAGCVVLPSRYREGVPRSLLEAAAMGIPVIASDMPGCRDAVEDGVNGFLCEPGNAGHLAALMERMLLLPPASRQAMAQAARRRVVEQFDERLVIARYLDAVQRLAGAPRPAPQHP